MREIGASDAFLYMTNTGRGYTMEIQLDMVFARPVDPEALQQAADGALALFPEFSAQLVTRQGRLMYQENTQPVRIVLTDDPAHMTVDYCTADTNGHVLYLYADRNDLRRVTFSYLHGMADFAGGMALLRTLLYRYQRLTAPETAEPDEAELTAAGIRTAVPDDWDRPENLDPYTVCGTPAENTPAAPPDPPFSVEGLPLYPVGTDLNHIWHVTTDSRAFLAKCRSLGTSFAPLILDTLLNSVADCFGAGEKTVAASLPVDLRPVFGIRTITNCSDGILLSLNAEQRRLPAADRCSLLKQSMAAQRTSECFGPAVYAKAQNARNMQDDPEGFVNLAARLLAPVLSGAPRKAPMTFVATYPGKTDLPAFMDGLLTDLIPVSVMGRVKFYFLITTFGSTMTVQVFTRYDDDALPQAVAATLRRMGLEAEVTDCGLRRQGCLLPEKLACID